MRSTLVALACLLSACATPEQEAAQRAAADQQYMGTLAMRCRSFGFQYETPEHAQCVMRLHQGNADRAAAMGAAIIGSGALAPRPLANPYQAPPPRPTLNTNCYTDSTGYTRCTTR